MKKSKLILLAVAAVAAIAAGTYFVVGRNSNAYLNAIPKNATAMARVDAKELLEDADLSLSEGMKLLKRLMADSTKNVGLDFMQPAYLFAAEDGDLGAVAAVSDMDELTAFISSLNEEGQASEITEARGYSWAVIQQQWLCAFDKQKALVMGPAVGNDQDELRNQMASLLSQGKSDSGQASELFKQLRKVEAPLGAVVSPEMMPDDVATYMHKAGIQSSKDALMLLSLGVDDNELCFQSEVLAYSEGVKDYVKQISELLRPMKCKLLEHAHGKNMAWLGINVDGPKLLEFLRSNEQVRSALIGMNMVVDMDRILEAIDGDVALELTNPVDFNSVEGIAALLNGLSFMACVENDDFMNGAADWGNDLFKMQAKGDKSYAMSLGDASLFLGVDDDIFYLGSEQGIKSSGNKLLNKNKDDIKGARFFASLELPALMELVSRQLPLPESVKDFEHLMIVMPEANKVELRLVGPEGKNIAKELLMNE